MEFIDTETIKVENNKDEQRFETEINGYTGVAEYHINGNQMIFTHTGVPRPIGGQGVANKLIKTALDYARENHLQVVPLCSFVSTYIRRHPEYKSLLSSGPKV
ncbi:MAG: acetyltransferase [Chloroflexi bacterium]|jgi:predicted GNAT family acetyltransferase|nr:acetyltransferase [Chloroflexota bacterium]